MSASLQFFQREAVDCNPNPVGQAPLSNPARKPGPMTLWPVMMQHSGHCTSVNLFVVVFQGANQGANQVVHSRIEGAYDVSSESDKSVVTAALLRSWQSALPGIRTHNTACTSTQLPNTPVHAQ